MTDPVSQRADWKQALLDVGATLKDAVRCLNDSSYQIVLVVAADGVLHGTLTDGDIRRGLLRGLTMESPVLPIVNREPFVAPPQLGREAALQLMRANGVAQLPLVDERRRVVGLFRLNDLMVVPRRENVFVIMAGGRGTRLHPYTEHCPKPMLPVGGKPMLEHIIERARGEGFGHFVLAVHYLGRMIEEYFGDGSRWKVRVDYLREDTPLGTAGALSLLEPQPEHPFVVTNGDVLSDIRYGELLDFHLRNGATATMAVRQHEWQNPFGVVRTQGLDIVGFDEKPVIRSHINAGVYVLSPFALSVLQSGDRCDMPALFLRLKAADARAIVYPMHEPWLDVGRPDDLSRANGVEA